MSLYFDGFFACDLKADIPQQVIDTLLYLTRKADYPFTDVPKHEFFQTEEWDDFLLPPDEFRVAPGWIGSEFKKMTRALPHDQMETYYTISFRRTMHDDVEFYIHWWHFLYWIAPYSHTEGYVGYYREEYSLHPVLIYIKNGRVFWHKITASPQGLTKEVWNSIVE